MITVDLSITYDCGYQAETIDTKIQVEDESKLPEAIGIIRKVGILIPLSDEKGIAILPEKIFVITYSIRGKVE